VAAIVIVPTLTLALPAQGATVKWICDVPGVPEPVTFVSAPGAALHGITQANATAGQVFLNQFGEVCTVVSTG
jgi:hypothetical protein